MNPYDGYLGVCFGTSDGDVFENSFFQIFKTAAAEHDIPCVMAVSSDRVYRNLLRSWKTSSHSECSSEHPFFDKNHSLSETAISTDNVSSVVLDIPSALEKLSGKGCRNIYVDSYYLARGTEFERMVDQVNAWGDRFEQISIREPLLLRKPDECCDVISHLYPSSDTRRIILLGHGSKEKNNAEYDLLQQNLYRAGRNDMQVILAEGIEPLADLLADLSFAEGQQVQFVPLMFCCGHHIHQIYQKLPVLCESLKIAPEFVFRGLGEESLFRKLFEE